MHAYALVSHNGEELQTAMAELQKYADANSLLVNESKTVLMIFRKRGNMASNGKIKYKNHDLNIVNSFK